MKSRLILFAAVIATAFMASCAAKKAVAMTQTDADRAAAKFPGATMASLSEGKTLYENNCGTCHGLKSTTSRNEAGWREIVPDMAQKAKVDSKTENLILQYVVTMGKP